jgi:hypothetical protein
VAAKVTDRHPDIDLLRGTGAAMERWLRRQLATQTRIEAMASLPTTGELPVA